MNELSALNNWDILVLILYFIGVIGLGIMFRKNETLADYFLAGRRTHWLAVGISIVATLFSAVSFVALPGEAYENGLSLYPRSPLVIIVAPLVILIFLPIYYRAQIYTVFEYLEQRFNLAVRLIASAVFLLVRSSYIAVVFYASAKAFEPVFHLPIPMMIFIIGLIATFYTVLGGMQAVIWTDVVQFVILFGGILIVLGKLIVSAGGDVSAIYSYASEHQRGFDLWLTDSFYSFSPYERVTLWAILAYVLVWNSYTYGVDQLTVQRYLSTKDQKSAARAAFFQFLLLLPFVASFWFVGTGLFYYYGQHPGIAPPPDFDSDSILSYFILTELPPGFVGLIFGAILAAVMSTVDSGINSLTTATIIDFYKRLGKTPRFDSAFLALSKKWTIFWGIFSMASACMIAMISEQANSAIIEVTAIWGNLNAVLLGVFLLGILTKRCTPLSIYASMIAGLFTAVYVPVVHYYHAPVDDRISFMWIGAIILFVTCFVGYAASWFSTPLKSDGDSM